MKDKIYLQIDCDIWTVKFTGAAAADAQELFGTDTLPAPFMASMPAETVKKAIQKLNPDCEVILKNEVDNVGC